MEGSWIKRWIVYFAKYLLMVLLVVYFDMSHIHWKWSHETLHLSPPLIHHFLTDLYPQVMIFSLALLVSAITGSTDFLLPQIASCIPSLFTLYMRGHRVHCCHATLINTESSVEKDENQLKVAFERWPFHHLPLSLSHTITTSFNSDTFFSFFFNFVPCTLLTLVPLTCCVNHLPTVTLCLCILCLHHHQMSRSRQYLCWKCLSDQWTQWISVFTLSSLHMNRTIHMIPRQVRGVQRNFL